MACNCEQLSEFVFPLSIDTNKFHSSAMHTLLQYPIHLIENNVYKCSSIAEIPNDININALIDEIKSQFCECLRSRIDLIKFVVVNQDCFGPQLGEAIASVSHCSNIVKINLDQIKSPEDLKSTLLHEIVHIFEFCPPCRDNNINNIAESEADRAFQDYKNHIKEFYDTIDKFREFLFNSLQNSLNNMNGIDVPDDFNYDKNQFIHIPKYKIIKDPTFIKSYDKGKLYVKTPETCLIAFLLDYGINQTVSNLEDRFLYASPNLGGREEFLAVFTQVFCDPTNNIFSEAFENIPDEFQECSETIKLSIRTLLPILRRFFNQNFYNIISRVCQIWTKLYSSSNNCNKNFNANYSIQFKCLSRDTENCCVSYQILMKSADAGCCDGINNSSQYISVGSIVKQNKCDCDFMLSLDINNNELNKMLTNCCADKTVNIFEIPTTDFIEHIRDQIVQAINGHYSGKVKIITDLSEKSSPCSK